MIRTFYFPVGPAPVSLEGLIAGQQRDDFALLIGSRNLLQELPRRASQQFALCSHRVSNLNATLLGREGKCRRHRFRGPVVSNS